jgi:hypothetical protein
MRRNFMEMKPISQIKGSKCVVECNWIVVEIAERGSCKTIQIINTFMVNFHFLIHKILFGRLIHTYTHKINSVMNAAVWLIVHPQTTKIRKQSCQQDETVSLNCGHQ